MKYIDNKIIDDNDNILIEIERSILNQIECVFEHNRFVIRKRCIQKVKKEDRENFLIKFNISKVWLHRVIKKQNAVNKVQVHISHVIYHDDKALRLRLSEETLIIVDKIIEIISQKNNKSKEG